MKAEGMESRHDQPPPIANDMPAVWNLVLMDMTERDQVGRARYGTPLQPHNGRDALKDAYQEALDMAVYLRQAIYERDECKAMTFGLAIEAIERGEKVARAGWNGKGMWLCLGKGNAALPADHFWNSHTRTFANASGGTAPVLPYVIMKTAGGEILMGWLASQSDMLAKDWTIVP